MTLLADLAARLAAVERRLAALAEGREDDRARIDALAAAIDAVDRRARPWGDGHLDPPRRRRRRRG